MNNPISQPYFQCERLDVYRVAVRLTELLPGSGAWQATIEGAEDEIGWRAYTQ